MSYCDFPFTYMFYQLISFITSSMLSPLITPRLLRQSVETQHRKLFGPVD